MYIYISMPPSPAMTTPQRWMIRPTYSFIIAAVTAVAVVALLLLLLVVLLRRIHSQCYYCCCYCCCAGGPGVYDLVDASTNRTHGARGSYMSLPVFNATATPSQSGLTSIHGNGWVHLSLRTKQAAAAVAPPRPLPTSRPGQWGWTLLATG